MDFFPAIVQVISGENYTVYAYCNDDAVRLVDMKPLIEQGGVFGCLQEQTFFAENLAVLNDTVAWDLASNRDATACIDLDPFWIFESAPIVEDPLRDNVGA